MPEIATRDGYGTGLLKVGKNPNIVALDADLSDSTKSIEFGKAFPERFFNVGIAEQNMMSIAAGLAASGKTVFASSFAIFSERGFEHFRNTVARPNLNVKLCGSHAGFKTGEDGSSAQCIEDFSVYRSLPNVAVISPADAVETEKAVEFLASYKGPSYMRTTRAKVPVIFDENYKFELGKGVVLKKGKDAVVFATGPLVHESLKAAEELQKEGINIYVVNIHTIKPIDESLVIKLAKETKAVVSAEDHNIIGGLGSAIAEVLCKNYPAAMEMVGVKDTFGESGTPEELYEKYGLTHKHIIKAVKSAIKRRPK
ncbi:MAG TPA: transketolase family protein [Candidatus Nanoarchaeia archaeon]|nr:transketolase family protein [Candidatus Nanoarchaeia archaeon]